eukprot:403368326
MNKSRQPPQVYQNGQVHKVRNQRQISLEQQSDFSGGAMNQNQLKFDHSQNHTKRAHFQYIEQDSVKIENTIGQNYLQNQVFSGRSYNGGQNDQKGQIKQIRNEELNISGGAGYYKFLQNMNSLRSGNIGKNSDIQSQIQKGNPYQSYVDQNIHKQRTSNLGLRNFDNPYENIINFSQRMSQGPVNQSIIGSAHLKNQKDKNQSQSSRIKYNKVANYAAAESFYQSNNSNSFTPFQIKEKHLMHIGSGTIDPNINEDSTHTLGVQAIIHGNNHPQNQRNQMLKQYQKQYLSQINEDLLNKITIDPSYNRISQQKQSQQKTNKNHQIQSVYQKKKDVLTQLQNKIMTLDTSHYKNKVQGNQNIQRNSKINDEYQNQGNQYPNKVKGIGASERTSQISIENIRKHNLYQPFISQESASIQKKKYAFPPMNRNSLVARKLEKLYFENDNYTSLSSRVNMTKSLYNNNIPLNVGQSNDDFYSIVSHQTLPIFPNAPINTQRIIDQYLLFDNENINQQLNQEFTFQNQNDSILKTWKHKFMKQVQLLVRLRGKMIGKIKYSQSEVPQLNQNQNNFMSEQKSYTIDMNELKSIKSMDKFNIEEQLAQFNSLRQEEKTINIGEQKININVLSQPKLGIDKNHQNSIKESNQHFRHQSNGSFQEISSFRKNVLNEPLFKKHDISSSILQQNKFKDQSSIQLLNDSTVLLENQKSKLDISNQNLIKQQTTINPQNRIDLAKYQTNKTNLQFLDPSFSIIQEQGENHYSLDQLKSKAKNQRHEVEEYANFFEDGSQNNLENRHDYNTIKSQQFILASPEPKKQDKIGKSCHNLISLINESNQPKYNLG